MQKKVSIVIPCYNICSSTTLIFDSIMAQTWDAIEVVLVNDGSTDSTLDALEAWQEKFILRGFEVKLISQKNQGVSAAIQSGMRMITGDLFCTVDQDDRLSTHYVQALASFLQQNESYDMVACDFKKVRRKTDGREIDITHECLEKQDSKQLVENYLFMRIAATVWILMVRTCYLKQTGLVDRFVTSPPIIQEPSIKLFLFSKEAKTHHIEDVLYTHYYEGDKTYFLARNWSLQKTAASDYATLCRLSIERLQIPEAKRTYYLQILALAAPKMEFYFSQNFRERPDDALPAARQAVEAVRSAFEPVPDISPEKLLENNYRVFYTAVENVVLGKTNRFLQARNPPLETPKRIIAYGVKGDLALELMPPLMNSTLRPTECWDQAAKEGEERFGYAVIPPNFESLQPGDVLLSVPRNLSVKQALQAQIPATSGVTVLYHFDILEYLAAHYYADMQEACVFVSNDA